MMYTKYLISLHFVFLLPLIGLSQSVLTIAGPSPRINNGLVVKSNGDIYASDLFGTGFNGQHIYKLQPNGTSELFASGLSQPAGLAFNEKGELYVAEFTSGEISIIDSAGNVNAWVTGFSQPADLVFDQQENLYVTNYGNGSISKITSAGEVSTLTTGLAQPVGLAIDNEQNLYTANLFDGKIYKVDLIGNKSLLATIDDLPIGFMTFNGQHLYVCSTGGHKIYRVHLSGEVEQFAGNGIPGTNDGDISEAQFTNPDGISASFTGDTIYVSENNTNLLRMIILDISTGAVESLEQYEPIEILPLYPNPSRGFSIANLYLHASMNCKISILASNGVYIKTIYDGLMSKGVNEIKFSTSDLSPGYYHLQVFMKGYQGKMIPFVILN